MNDGVEFIRMHSIFLEPNAALERSKVPLFHHTQTMAVASSIAGGCFWFTRADCFFDQLEIRYGIEVFLEAQSKRSDHKSKEENEFIIKRIGESLRNSYILSLTDSPNRPFMRKLYGEYVVKIAPWCIRTLFSAILYSKQTGGDGWNLFQLNDIFERVEGHVVYERSEQVSRASKVLEVLDHVRENKSSDKLTYEMEVMELHRLISTNIVLFKRESFCEEQEYRVCLVRKPNLGFELDPAFEFPHPARKTDDGRDKMMLEVNYRADHQGLLEIL